MPFRRASSIPTLLLALAAAGCARQPSPVVDAAPVAGVEPLQPFGSEPALMPALTFEPLAGRLDISAPLPVYVTVVEVDPTTQAQTVVFPEVGRAPLRVAGSLSLQLELSRGVGGDALRRRAGQAEGDHNRGRCATGSAGSGEEGASHCRSTTAAPPGETPSRTVLVIASTDTLVVGGGRGTMAWRIPDEMPGDWAAVYVWAGARPAAP